MPEKSDVRQGQMAQMALKTLDLPGPLRSDGLAHFNRLTKAGHKQLQTETHDWEQTAAIIARFFTVKREELS